jgi:unsaturated rhamnogalacturonyl hydrolase
MRAERIVTLLPAVAMAILVSPLSGGCTSGGGGSGQNSGGASAGQLATGATSSAGGATAPGAGGTMATGGASSAGGKGETGGSTGAGGSGNSGGAPGSGGATVRGGSTVSGGTTGSGGTASSGAASGSGGLASVGGTNSGAGGNTATGGAGTGGALGGGAGGGRTGTGGSAGSGGRAGSGGSTVSGGATGSAGSSGGAASGACPQVSEFATWPSGKGPADIGKLAAASFKSHTGDGYGGAGYAWAFTYFGSLQFTKLTGDTTYNASLISQFDCGQQGPDNSATASVDYRAFGDLPFEIYLENQAAACKTLGLTRADAQWSQTTSDGITKDARYWIDDMYMITGLQVFAYRATQDAKYLNRAAQTMLAYISALQQSDGLFWHTKQSKAYWGRANGWVAAGMTLLLLELPAGTNRDSIMAAYKKQLDGLLPLQIGSGTDSGAWRQVLDLASSNAESSCTAMFTYALVTGLKNGWLTDSKYATVARNGWIALGNKTNGSGQLDKVCPGTGQAAAGSLSSQQQFYATIALGSNDMHGQAPLLWTATALLRTDCPGLR